LTILVNYDALEKNTNLKFDEIIADLKLISDNDERWYGWNKDGRTEYDIVLLHEESGV